MKRDDAQTGRAPAEGTLMQSGRAVKGVISMVGAAWCDTS
jgi:hypothetical protein